MLTASCLYCYPILLDTGASIGLLVPVIINQRCRRLKHWMRIIETMRESGDGGRGKEDGERIREDGERKRGRRKKERVEKEGERMSEEDEKVCECNIQEETMKNVK